MRHITVCWLIFLLASCAAARQQTFYDEMNASIGVLTVTGAIARFGSPAYERREPSGESLLTWEWRHATTSSQTGFELGAAQRGWIPYRQTTSVHAETLILGFGPNGRLTWWRHQP